MITVGYAGRENCLFMFFLIKSAMMLNQKVIVLDNSFSGDLHKVLTNDSGDDILETDMHLFLRNYKMPKKAFDNYDYAFVYNGLKPLNEPYDFSVDVMYVETSVALFEIEATRKAYESMGEKITSISPTLIMVDSVINKISVGKLAEELNIEFENGYALPLVEGEIAKYQLLTRNGTVRIKGVSKDFASAIREQVAIIFDLYKKNLDKLMRKL